MPTNLFREALRKAFAPVAAIVVVPWHFVRYPFSVHYFSRNPNSGAYAVSFVFELVLLQIFLLVTIPNQAFQQFSASGSVSGFSSFMSAPVVSGLLYVYHLLLVLGSAIPALRYLNNKSNQDILAPLASLLLLFVGLFKLVGFIQALPLIIASVAGAIEKGQWLGWTQYSTGIGYAIAVYLLLALCVNIHRMSERIVYRHILVAGVMWFLVWLVLVFVGTWILFSINSYFGG